MAERRYTEEEVSEIFQRATETQALEYRRPPSSAGLTLAELKGIGRDVGIEPEVVARAALALDQAPLSTDRRLFGFPIGVGRTVELGRRLSDHEWERLVVDMRETFDAKGTVSQDGTLRQWTNGNLHAYLEPGGSGHRLRMRTYNGRARMLIYLGSAYAGLGVFAVAVKFAKHGLDPSQLLAGGLIGAVGLGIAATGALRLPGWARRRLQKIETEADRVLAAPPAGHDQSDG